MKYKIYRGEVVPGVFDWWLDVLDVPCRLSVPVPLWELHSYKGDAIVERTLGRRSREVAEVWMSFTL